MADTKRNIRHLLKGKQLYLALYGVYKKVLHYLTAVFQQSATERERTKATITAPPSVREFREQRKRKMKRIDDADKRTKILQHPPRESTTSNCSRSLKFQPRNFSPHWSQLNWKLTRRRRGRHSESHLTSQAGRPPPIVPTSQVNLVQLQRQLKGLLKGNFEFRNTRNESRVVTKGIEHFSAIRSHLESNNLPYITFYHKSQKPIKAFSCLNPAEDNSDGLVDLSFDVINVKQMSTILRSPAEGKVTENIRLCLKILTRDQSPMRYSTWWSFAILQSRWRRTMSRLVSRSVTTANNSTMPGLTASTLPLVCRVGTVTCIMNFRKMAIHHQYRHAATAIRWTEGNLIPLTVEAAGTPRKRRERESRRESPRLQRKGGLFQLHNPRTTLRGGAKQQHTATAAASAALSCTGLPRHCGRNECPPSLEAQPTTSIKTVSSGS
jgi:hypothetical protein